MQYKVQYPIISVTIPVYNSGMYLRKCLDSVINQSYTNIEIIIVNNGSTDDSAIIIKEYQINDDRINVYNINHVKTPKESRDNAIAKATSDWIIAIDADDSIESNYIEKLWNRHLETGADFVGGVMTFKGSNDEIYKTIPDFNFDLSVCLTGEDAMKMTLDKWMFGFNGALIKKTNLNNISTNASSLVYTDECDTRVYLHNCQKVVFVNAIYWYSWNPLSTGRKLSLTSLLYGVKTWVGILVYFNKIYNHDSPVLIKMQRLLWNNAFLGLRLLFTKLPKLGRVDIEDLKIFDEAFNLYQDSCSLESKLKYFLSRILFFLIKRKLIKINE